MASYHLNLIGLFLDITGVFLLAVEAIKLSNLRKLRKDVVLRWHHSILPRPVILARSLTRYRRVGWKPDLIIIKPEERLRFKRSFYRFMFSHYVGGMFGTLFLLLLLQLFGLNIWKAVRSIAQKDLIIITLVFLFIIICFIVLMQAAVEMFAATLIPFYFMAFLTVGFPPLLIFWIVGEGLHQGGIKLSKVIILVLDFIDRKTPDGTIGIIGFLLAVVGFVFQFIGTWVGGALSHP